MAIRTIRTEEDSILRIKSKEVKVIDEKIIELLDDMKETMFEANGVGLAAVQVGVLKRIFIACFDEYSEDAVTECINPIIVSCEGEQTGEEGCLSLPNKSGVRKRPYAVTLQYTDRNGETFEVQLEDFSAVICMHEFEHLNGKLYVDELLSEEELLEYKSNLIENSETEIE